MMTAILFGSLVIGGWARGPPSASAGRPRLWRRPAALRGDVCGDARTRRAADGRGLGRRPSQVSKAAGPRLCRASPSTLVMAARYAGLKSIPREKAVGAVAYALDQCQARRFKLVNPAKYHADFVPAFMKYLGLMDVNKVPARSTLEEVYQSHLANQEVARIQAESETYKNKKDESDDKESHGSDDDEEEEYDSDGYVGSDDDAAAVAPASASVATRTARPQRGVTQSEDQLQAERLAPVRSALNGALLKLKAASGGKKAMQKALGSLGFSGDDVLRYDGSFGFDDKACAMKWAKVALPDVVFNPEKIPDARTVWRSLLGYYHGLGDDKLEKQIAAVRERCAEASLPRRRHPKAMNMAPSALTAANAAIRKRKQMDEEANEDADLDLIACGVFAPDGRGAKPGTATPFGRVLEPLAPTQLPSYVAPREGPETFYGVDSATDQRLAVNSGDLVAKLAMGAGKYDIGIGLDQGQEPVATILRPLGVAAVATLGAWCGLELPDQSGRKFSHRGQETLATILIDVYKPARVWAVGGDYDWKEAMPRMGLRVDSSEIVQTQEYGPLDGFEKVCFVGGGIPGGLTALDEDRVRLAARMREAVAAQGDNAGSVRLGPCVIKKLNPSKPAAESNFRLFVCGPNRKTGEIRDETRVTLDYLRRENYAALHYVAERAALLGNIKLRLLAYAHAGSGRFHFDGVGGPQTARRMAGALTAAAPANLDSLNFSLASGPVQAHMGPI